MVQTMSARWVSKRAAPDHVKERNRFRHRFLGLAHEAYRWEAISRGKLEKLFAALPEKKREEIALAKYGVVSDEPPTPVEIPA
jgi:hypothetical protein